MPGCTQFRAEKVPSGSTLAASQPQATLKPSHGQGGDKQREVGHTFLQRLLDLLWVIGRFHILVSGKRMQSSMECTFR